MGWPAAHALRRHETWWEIAAQDPPLPADKREFMGLDPGLLEAGVGPEELLTRLRSFLGPGNRAVAWNPLPSRLAAVADESRTLKGLYGCWQRTRPGGLHEAVLRHGFAVPDLSVVPGRAGLRLAHAVALARGLRSVAL